MRYAVALTLLATPCLAQESPPDKSGFSLIDPTPRELRRPLSADRPDLTESPYTVDAGAAQFEISFVDYSRDGDDESWAIAPINFKLGLLNDVDAQFVFTPYALTESSGTTAEGFGETQFRLKINMWGNDRGRTALAVMPFIVFPTGADGIGPERVEGGLIFPFAIELSETVGLGLMFETDLLYDDLEGGYDTEFIGTAAVGVDLTERLGGYAEAIGISAPDADTELRAILGLGATYALTADAVLDAGVNFGLTDDTDDVNFFSGITLRF